MYDDNLLRKYHVWGFVFSIALGVLMYFLYDLTNQNYIVGLFVPSKNTYWEYLKLFYFPFGIWTVIEYCILNRWYDNIPTGNFLGLVFGMVVIPLAWWACDFFLGNHYRPLDIALFVLGSCLAYLISYLILSRTRVAANWICTLFFLLVGCGFLFSGLFPDLVGLAVCKGAIETLKLLGNVGKCNP